MRRPVDPAPVELLNPLAQDASWLRSSPLEGVLGAVATNVRRQQPDVRIFELCKTYARTETTERAVAAGKTGVPEPARAVAADKTSVSEPARTVATDKNGVSETGRTLLTPHSEETRRPDPATKVP